MGTAKARALLLGLDVGTSGAKAILIDAEVGGEVVAESTTLYGLSTPRPLWSEQDPEDWWRASCESIRQVMSSSGARGEEVCGVGLTGQMHGLVLLDGAGRVLRPAILWNDQRTGAQCESITRLVTKRRLLELTGNVVLPGFTAPKILWVREHEPEVYGRAAHVLLPKDYVRYRLSGVYATDVADASGTSLLDVGKRVWSEEMLAHLDLPKSWMPALHESTEATSVIHGEGARATGLSAGTAIAAGAGDQAAQAVGSGITSEGAVGVTIGTSGVVFAAANAYRHEPEGRLHAFCHATGRSGWHMMGVMLSAGGSLRWFRDGLCGEEKAEARRRGVDPYEVMMEGAAEAPAGARGLLFLPYLTGERTPHPDPLARGAFVGLTIRHGKGELTRAVVEGVTFGLKDCLDLLAESGIDVREVRVSGGGARSGLWRQILADVFDVPVAMVNSTEGAAYGAALIAGAGVGQWGSVAEAAAACVREVGRTEPQKCEAAVYREAHAVYRTLYGKLEETFAALGRLEGG